MRTLHCTGQHAVHGIHPFSTKTIALLPLLDRSRHMASPRAAPGDGAMGPSDRAPERTSPASSASGGAPNSTGVSLLDRVKEWFSGSKEKKNKEKLASLGAAAVISYGVISNVTYGTCLTFAWISFVKQTGVTPLASGQWPAFLAFYAGIWAVQNFARPARFALAMAMAPLYDRLMDWMARKTGMDKRVSFVALLICTGLCTSALLFSAIYLLGGLPDGFGFIPPLRRS